MEPDPLVESYDRLAEEYAAHIAGELAHKPFDRELLDRFAARVRGRGPVADLGCGPGHVAKYLRDRGVDVFGLDVSTGMVEVARRLYPGVPFQTGDLCALEARDGAWAGAVSFYAIVHLDDAALERACRELYRALRQDGVAIVAFHVGTGSLHRDELWGVPVALDFRLFDPEHVCAALTGAGLTIESATEREPYPEVEYPSRRAYLTVVKARSR